MLEALFVSCVLDELAVLPEPTAPSESFLLVVADAKLTADVVVGCFEFLKN